MKERTRKGSQFRRNTGAITALMAALLFMLFGMAVLVIYLSSGFGVNMELQNAVDAGTLAVANQTAKTKVTLNQVDSQNNYPNQGPAGRTKASCSYFLHDLGAGPAKDEISLANYNDMLGAALIIAANMENVHYCQMFVLINSLNYGSSLANQVYIPEKNFFGSNNPTVQLFSDPLPHRDSLIESIKYLTKALNDAFALGPGQDRQRLFADVVAKNPARMFGLLPAHRLPKLDSVIIEPVYYKATDVAAKDSNITIWNDCIPDVCRLRGNTFFPDTQPAGKNFLPQPVNFKFGQPATFAWLSSDFNKNIPANTDLFGYGIYALPKLQSGGPTLAHLISVRDANQYLAPRLNANLQNAIAQGHLLPSAVKVTATFIDPNTNQKLTFYAAAVVPLPYQDKIAQIPNGFIELTNSTASYTSLASTFGLTPNLAQFGTGGYKRRARVIRRGMQSFLPLINAGGPTGNITEDGQWPNEIYPGIAPFQLINQLLLVAIQQFPSAANALVPSTLYQTAGSNLAFDGNYDLLLKQICAPWNGNPNYGVQQIRIIRYVHQFAYRANWDDDIAPAMASLRSPVNLGTVPSVAALTVNPDRPGYVKAIDHQLPGTPFPPGEPPALVANPPRLCEYSSVWLTPGPSSNPSPYQPRVDYRGRYNPDFLQLASGSLKNGTILRNPNGDKIPNVVRGYYVMANPQKPYPYAYPDMHDELSVTYFNGMYSGQILQLMFGTEGFQNYN